MNRTNRWKMGVAIAALACTAGPAFAESFNVSAGDLKAALDSYANQAGVTLAYSEDAVKGVRTKGAVGDLSPQAALSRILSGTGFAPRSHDGAIGIVRDPVNSSELPAPCSSPRRHLRVRRWKRSPSLHRSSAAPMCNRSRSRSRRSARNSSHLRRPMEART